MAQPEARISREIMKALRLEGYFCFKVHGSEHMMAGLPDIIVCAEGFFLSFETKTPLKRGNTSVKQDQVHSQIIAAGGMAVVVSSPQEALEVARQWLADVRRHRSRPRA